MRLHDPRLILQIPSDHYSVNSISELCDHVTDAFLVPFFEDQEEVTAERIACIRQSSMQCGTPTTVVASIPWMEGAHPSGIALALAKGVDWILASNIHSLEELKRFQGLLSTGSKYVPLMVRIPDKVFPVLAEELLISSQGIWGDASSLTPSLLHLAHQLGKLTVLEVTEFNETDISATHAVYRNGSQSKRPTFGPYPADPQVGNDVLWAADALRSRRPNSKVIVVCENLEEVGYATSLGFHHGAIVICKSVQLLRSANLFRGFPAVLDTTTGSLEQFFLSSQERLSALRLIQPGDTLIYVTNNLSAIHCRTI